MHFIAINKVIVVVQLGVIVPPDSWMVELSEGLDPQIGYHLLLLAMAPKFHTDDVPLPRSAWCF